MKTGIYSCLQSLKLCENVMPAPREAIPAREVFTGACQLHLPCVFAQMANALHRGPLYKENRRGWSVGT